MKLQDDLYLIMTQNERQHNSNKVMDKTCSDKTPGLEVIYFFMLNSSKHEIPTAYENLSAEK